MGTVKVDCRHDAVAALLVDDPLDRLAVVRDRLVRAVDVWLLQDPLVKATHRKVRHHRLHIVVADRRQRLLELGCRIRLELSLAEEELGSVGVGQAELRRKLVEGESRLRLRSDQTARALGHLVEPHVVVRAARHRSRGPRAGGVSVQRGGQQTRGGGEDGSEEERGASEPTRRRS